jgi:DNA-directed RNA polymerase beta' subunit
MAKSTTVANVLDQNQDDFSSVSIQLASPEDIRGWSYGEVKKPETINYRTYRAEKDGLFCERIFGPERDWECFCGKYKGMKHKGIICDRCGVKVTHSRERRKRMGHINLAAPIVHIWFFKAMPSRLGNLLAMKTTNLEKLIYFQEYVVIDPGPAAAEGVREKDLLTEDKYRRLKETYGDAFVADMGAEAARELLKKLDLVELAKELRVELAESGSKQRKKTIVKQLKLVEAIKDSPNKPEWMVMDVIPVIPPDLRPLVLLESGNFATSDLNDLYRRVINRNNRLKKLQDLHAPEVIIRNEKRMLQQAVDSLFDNDRTKRPVLGSSNRPLKSLTDMIKGKQGRFRENLLGKRVDYSARSVIVVGPELKLHQCGLPKKIALELFQPFIIRRLKELGYVDTIKSAKKMLERKDEEVWDILDEVIHEHPVLLNRAPTLHRMGIQAFEPVLVEGNAIKIHPLVCEAFNADFDGDQMAVHLPLSFEAQAEASILMMSTNNIFSPADGEPIIRPSLDMVLGIYFLTYMQPGPMEGLKAFSDPTEVLLALEEGRVHLQQPIQVRLPANTVIVEQDDERVLEPPYRLTTTAGRVRFNQVAAVGDRFYDLAVDKRAVNMIISDCHRLLGRADTIRLLDDIKSLGFTEATLAGCSISAEDLQMPPDKQAIIDTAQGEVDKIQKHYTNGLITDSERHHQITEAWTHASNAVADRVMDELEANTPKNEALELVLLENNKIDATSYKLTADNIAYIIGAPLPTKAAETEALWLDQVHNPLNMALAHAGWRIGKLNISGGKVTSAEISLELKSGRYAPFEKFLKKHEPTSRIADIGVKEIKQIVGCEPPDSAAACDLYWRDTAHNPLGLAIGSAGWRVVRIDRDRSGRVNGARIERASTINPLWCMFDSGARGSAMQIRQMAGMRGLMAKPSGEIMETPIKANFREGLPVLEYFSSTHGGRKGLADTALKTAESGYLTRKLADVAQQCVVGMPDCTTTNGITKTAGDVGLSRNIYGRVAGETVVDRRSDTVIVEEGQLITDDIARAIEDLGYDSLKVRSPLTCEATTGVCAKCYGMDLSTQQLVEEGLAVGIIAAQSIGEPGTQLTMRTFHIGGIATTAGAEPDRVAAAQGGTIHYDNINYVEDPDGDLVVMNQNGALILRDGEGRDLGHYPMRIGATLQVKDGAKTAAKKVLATWDPHMSPIITEKSGLVRFIDIEEGETMRKEIDSGGSERSVIVEHKGDLHPQIMIEDRQGEILGIYSIPEKAYIEVNEDQAVKAGQLLARTPRQVGRTQDITAGLPRVTELFEARKPKDPAIMSEISGVVHLGERKRGKRSIIVRNEAADMEREHLVPQGKRLLVTAGSTVREGDPLVDGPLVPHDILRIKGEEELQKYLLQEVQNVYRFCGEEINDKHMEVIIAQMLHKVQVGEDVGETNLLPGSIVDKFQFREENERVVTEGGTPASASALLLGITKAALRSESFISAASFQETTKVLTEAALAGKRDNLTGLKENVILGHMVPAGTGFHRYRNALMKKEEELPEDTTVAAS